MEKTGTSAVRQALAPVAAHAASVLPAMNFIALAVGWFTIVMYLLPVIQRFIGAAQTAQAAVGTIVN